MTVGGGTATGVGRLRRWSPAPRVEGSGAVLSLIRDGRARTVGDLAAAMDMARSTVVQRVDNLVAAGLVTSGPTAAALLPGGRGRPPAVLRFNADAGVVLVAHLGMTGARVAATDLDAHVLAERFEAFAIADGLMRVLARLRDSLGDVLRAADRHHSEVVGVGIGLPSAVELSVGQVGVARSAVWEVPIAAGLHEAFGAPVFVDNDVNLLALGEQRSCWPGAGILLCLKAGSVLGCATVVDGRILRGAQGVAGGLGHLPVPGDRTPCSCGNAGCLDVVASGRALVGQLRSAGLAVQDARDVAALARAEVPEAVQAVRAAGRAIGEVLSYAVNLLNPGVIAVWGYLVEAEIPLLAGIREGVYQRSLPAATHALQLVRARLGDGAGLAGAAGMVLSHVLAPEAVDEHLVGRRPAAQVAVPPRAGAGAGAGV